MARKWGGISRIGTQGEDAGREVKGGNKRNEIQQRVDAVKPLLVLMVENWKQAVFEQVRNRAAAAIRAVACVRRYGSE